MRSKPQQSRAVGQAAVQVARGKRCPEARLQGVWAILQAWAEDNALLNYPVFCTQRAGLVVSNPRDQVCI